MEAFDKFQLEEYKKVAEAHFKTNESISSFFRYYLAIMAIPGSVLGLVAMQKSGLSATDLIAGFRPFLSPALVVVAFVGMLVMIYTANLRFDALLYARSVNAIRNYFSEQSDADLANVQRYRVLPRSAQIPAYFEPLYFFSVVLTFALFNGSYLFLAMSIAEGPSYLYELRVFIPPLAWAALFLIAHMLLYYCAAQHREHSYLKSTVVGIDIDGVLNEHRRQFCNRLERNTGRHLDPEQITTIPVREIPGLQLTKEEHEIPVFHDVKYWSEMPVAKNAALVVQRIRNSFHLKIAIFSLRNWPDTTFIKSKTEQTAVRLRWEAELYELNNDSRLPLRKRLKWGLMPLFGRRCRMQAITELWLHKNNIPYDSIHMEWTRESVSEPRYLLRNRFNEARKQRIRFFIEDTWENALKLAHHCDVVFLINHPYNSNEAIANATAWMSQPPRLPRNIVRVDSWTQVYGLMRLAV